MQPIADLFLLRIFNFTDRSLYCLTHFPVPQCGRLVAPSLPEAKACCPFPRGGIPIAIGREGGIKWEGREGVYKWEGREAGK